VSRAGLLRQGGEKSLSEEAIAQDKAFVGLIVLFTIHFQCLNSLAEKKYSMDKLIGSLHLIWF